MKGSRFYGTWCRMCPQRARFSNFQPLTPTLSLTNSHLLHYKRRCHLKNTLKIYYAFLSIRLKSIFRHNWGMMVYRCLHGQAPRYLADNLIPASDAAPCRLRLRSANRNCLTVPRCCRLSTYGCRAFDYAGPTVWNLLPDELRNSDSFDKFERFMKTILFSRY